MNGTSWEGGREEMNKRGERDRRKQGKKMVMQERVGVGRKMRVKEEGKKLDLVMWKF